MISFVIGFLTIALGVLPLLGFILLKRLLDQIMQPALGVDVRVTRADVFISVEYIAIVAFATLAVRSILNLVSEIQALRVADHVKSILHAKSIELDLEFYENAEHQDTMRRAQQEAPYRPTRIANAVLQTAQSGVSLLVIGGFLAVTLHWAFVLVLLFAALPGLWVRARQAKENFELQRRQTATERKSAYIDMTLTNDWFAKELRLFDLGGFFSKLSKDLRDQLREEKISLGKRRLKREMVTHFFWTLALYGSLGAIVLRAAGGIITFGSLVMYYQMLQRGQAALQEFLQGMANLYENSLFLQNLSEFLELKPRIVAPAQPKKIPQPIRVGVAFENVSFSYPGKDAFALRDVSFTIPVGHKIALVGENGSGKTTLVKLLCRLYDPTHGGILLDGVDVRELSVVDLRRQFSVIFQDFVRYHLSLAQNIGLGDLEAAKDSAKVVAAAQKSGADDFIRKFPEGYETQLGRVFHEGEELSGGEWQKIALARAFLREAPFIIMDEPTSALDARAEYELFERFAKMAAGRTAILISHRLSTVRMADTILMMDHGRIVEQGSHDELVARGGAYARLFEMQAKNYR